jgi:hypothetical protein
MEERERGLEEAFILRPLVIRGASEETLLTDEL